VRRAFLSTFILALSCLTSGVAAQQINEQWLGHWVAPYDHLIVTSKNIVDAGNICKWVGKAPAGEHAGCVGFYSGTTSKKEMLATFQTMRDALRESGQNTDAQTALWIKVLLTPFVNASRPVWAAR